MHPSVDGEPVCPWPQTAEKSCQDCIQNHWSYWNNSTLTTQFRDSFFPHVIRTLNEHWPDIYYIYSPPPNFPLFYLLSFEVANVLPLDICRLSVSSLDVNPLAKLGECAAILGRRSGGTFFTLYILYSCIYILRRMKRSITYGHLWSGDYLPLYTSCRFWRLNVVKGSIRTSSDSLSSLTELNM